MKLLHFVLKWNLLICRWVEFSFCNLNLYFNILFWILKHFYLNFLSEYQRWQHFVNRSHFCFVKQFIPMLLEGLVHRSIHIHMFPTIISHIFLVWSTSNWTRLYFSKLLLCFTAREFSFSKTTALLCVLTLKYINKHIKYIWLQSSVADLAAKQKIFPFSLRGQELIFFPI